MLSFTVSFTSPPLTSVAITHSLRHQDSAVSGLLSISPQHFQSSCSCCLKKIRCRPLHRHHSDWLYKTDNYSSLGRFADPILEAATTSPLHPTKYNNCFWCWTNSLHLIRFRRPAYRPHTYACILSKSELQQHSTTLTAPWITATVIVIIAPNFTTCLSLTYANAIGYLTATLAETIHKTSTHNFASPT